MIRQSLNKLKLIQQIAMVLILLFTFVSVFISNLNTRKLREIDDAEKYARQQEINVHEIAYATLSYVYETDSNKIKKILDSKEDFQTATEQLLSLNLLDESLINTLLVTYEKYIKISDHITQVSHKQGVLKSKILEFSQNIRLLFANEYEDVLTSNKDNLNSTLVAYEHNLLSLLNLLDLDSKDETLVLMQTIELLEKIKTHLVDQKAKLKLSPKQVNLVNEVTKIHQALDTISTELVNAEQTNTQQITLLSSTQSTLDDLLDNQIQSQLESDYNQTKTTLELYEHIELINVLALLLIFVWSTVKVRNINKIITNDLGVLIDQTVAIAHGKTTNTSTMSDKRNEFSRINQAMISMHQVIKETNFSRGQLETLLNCIGDLRIMIHADGSLSGWSDSLIKYLEYDDQTEVDQIALTDVLGDFIDFNILQQMITSGVINQCHWHLISSKNTFKDVKLTGLKIDGERLVLIGNIANFNVINSNTHTLNSGENSGILLLDADQTISEVNSVAASIIQLPSHQILNKQLGHLLKEIHCDKPLSLNTLSTETEDTNLTEISFQSNEDTVKKHANVQVVKLSHQEQQDVYVLILNDITALRHSQEKIRNLAYNDVLTGLPNRSKLIEYTKEATLINHQNQTSMALLYIDLDNFKNINDAFGHDAGDQMLKKISQRLLEQVPKLSLVARIGGDEFCVVLNEVRDTSYVEKIVESCLASIAKPIFIQSVKIFPACSIGIAIYPKDGRTNSTLLKSADIAMYAAKAAGKNRYAYYTSSLAEAARKRVNFESMLQKQIREDNFSGFEIYYQPKVEISAGKIVGFEVLTRFNHATKGMILPDHFIPVIERIGLISDLDFWVLKNACQYTLQLHAKGYRDLSVAVNISPSHFIQKEFVSEVSRILEQLNYPANLLEIEITENVFTDSSEQMKNFMALNKLGVKVSIDDFGTGYSSLSQLQQLPINILKIDKTFIRELGKKDQADKLIKSIKDMTDSLGISTVVEGVETAQQLAILKELQYDVIQGYYFSRPVPASEVMNLLESKMTQN